MIISDAFSINNLIYYTNMQCHHSIYQSQVSKWSFRSRVSVPSLLPIVQEVIYYTKQEASIWFDVKTIDQKNLLN